MKKSKSSHSETLSDYWTRNAAFFFLIPGALCIIVSTVLYATEVLFNPNNATFAVETTSSALLDSVVLWILGVVFMLLFMPFYLYSKAKRRQREELVAEGRFVWADIVSHKKQYVKPWMYFRAICEYRDGGEMRVFKSDWFEGGSTQKKTSEMERGKVKVWYDGAKRYFVDMDDFYDRIFEEIMKEIEDEWDNEDE